MLANLKSFTILSTIIPPNIHSIYFVISYLVNEFVNSLSTVCCLLYSCLENSVTPSGTSSNSM